MVIAASLVASGGAAFTIVYLAHLCVSTVELQDQNYEMVVPAGAVPGTVLEFEVPASQSACQSSSFKMGVPVQREMPFHFQRYDPNTVEGVIKFLVNSVVEADFQERRARAAQDRRIKKEVRGALNMIVHEIIRERKERAAMAREVRATLNAVISIVVTEERKKMRAQKAEERKANQLKKEREEMARLIAKAAAKRAKLKAQAESRVEKEKKKILREEQRAAQAAEQAKARAEKARRRQLALEEKHPLPRFVVHGGGECVADSYMYAEYHAMQNWLSSASQFELCPVLLVEQLLGQT